MAFNRCSINCRLFIIQLVLAILLYCLQNVAREMRQLKQHATAHPEDPDVKNPIRNDQFGKPLPVSHDEFAKDSEVANRGVLQQDENEQRFIDEADSTLTAVELFQRAGLFRCPSMRRRSSIAVTDSTAGTWLKLDGRVTFYIYSVYHDTRLHDVRRAEESKLPRPSWLRFLVSAAAAVTDGDNVGFSSTPVYCHAWYIGIDQSIVVEGRVNRLDQAADQNNVHQSGMQAYSIVCSLPPIPDNLDVKNGGPKVTLEYVALAIGTECPENNAEMMSLTVFRPEVGVSNLVNNGQSNVAVCVAPTSKESLEAWSVSRDNNNQLHAPWFIEWMELLTMFGATKVRVYILCLYFSQA